MKRWILSAWTIFLGFLIISGCASVKASSSPAPDSFPISAFGNGDWSWEFKADGTFVSSGPLGSESGTYSLSGNQVVITCQCCGNVQGTYKWSFNGTALKFNVIDDKCANRKDVIDASTWSKEP